MPGAMTARMACQHVLARVTGLVLVLPFLLLAGIAPGYMPVRGADGVITMVICADGMPVEVAVDAATGEPVAVGQGGHDGLPDSTPKAPEDGRCAWAQLAVAVQPESLPVILPPRRLAVAFTPVAPDDLWRPAHDPRGLWARGPPAFV